MRLTMIPVVVVLGLLLVAVALPSRRDTSVRAWWTRVRYQIDFFARAVLALAAVAAFVWYVLLPMMGWRAAAR